VDPDVVKKAPLFAALDDEAAATLMKSMSQTRMERGDILFHEGDQGDRLYVIREGKVKLGRRSPDGRENLVAILGPGEMFGELSLFDPGPRTMTATAVAETQLLGLGNEDLAGLLAGRPAVAKVLLAALAQRLRRTNENLADLVFTDVPGRVAKALLDLADRFGASRETVNKALADFATRGWLRLEARSVLLLDVERLKRRAR
jgi:CRP/FNR family cyclic AMP-dependent transcriptional regulator